MGLQRQTQPTPVGGPGAGTSSDSIPPVLSAIWSSPECLLVMYTASSAEFALNPAAEWLFLTGDLPADPVKRFFRTIDYMRELLLTPNEAARERACARVRGIHTGLERRYGRSIPDAAFCDVLVMNLTQAVRSNRLVFGRPLSGEAVDSIIRHYGRVARYMGIADFPSDYAELARLRAERLRTFRYSHTTQRLLAAYRTAMGRRGYRIMRIVYGAALDPQLLALLGMRRGLYSRLFERGFPLLCRWGMHRWLMPSRVSGVWRRLARAEIPIGCQATAQRSNEGGG